MRLKPSEIKLLGPKALAQIHAQGIDVCGDLPEDKVPKSKKARKAAVRPSADLSGLSTWDGETLTVVLPIPNRLLSPNTVHHFKAATGLYMARMRAKRLAREEAKITALEALCGHPAPMWTHAIEQTTWYARTKVKADGDNRLGTLKAALDGLTDAGIWIDDSGLTHEPVVMVHDPLRPRVEIRVKEKR